MISGAQTSLAPGKSQAVELVRIVDLKIVMLPKGSLSIELVDDKIIVSTLKNIDLNIAMLPNEYLHVLQIGIKMQLRV